MTFVWALVYERKSAEDQICQLTFSSRIHLTWLHFFIFLSTIGGCWHKGYICESVITLLM